MDALPAIGTQVWIGPGCGPVFEIGRRYRFIVHAAERIDSGTALITGQRAGVTEQPYPLPVLLDGLRPVTKRARR